jgi:hypothetical protein
MIFYKKIIKKGGDRRVAEGQSEEEEKSYV